MTDRTDAIALRIFAARLADVLAEARRLHAAGATHDCGEWRSGLLTPAGGFVSGVCLVCGGESAAPDQAENGFGIFRHIESAYEGPAPKPDRRK